MRISQVCQRAGVAATTLKYYIREGLVPEGDRLGGNRTAYTMEHVRRVRLVRALIQTGGLSIAATKGVLAVLDADPASPAEVFQVAQQALGAVHPTREPSAEAAGRIDDLISSNQWCADRDNPGFELAAQALDGLATCGFSPADDYLQGYADAAEAVARKDLDALTTRDRPELMTELMVVGTVMGDVLAAGLRRLAHQHVTASVFRHVPGADNTTTGTGPRQTRAETRDPKETTR